MVVAFVKWVRKKFAHRRAAGALRWVPAGTAYQRLCPDCRSCQNLVVAKETACPASRDVSNVQLYLLSSGRPEKVGSRAFACHDDSPKEGIRDVSGEEISCLRAIFVGGWRTRRAVAIGTRRRNPGQFQSHCWRDQQSYPHTGVKHAGFIDRSQQYRWISGCRSSDNPAGITQHFPRMGRYGHRHQCHDIRLFRNDRLSHHLLQLY